MEFDRRIKTTALYQSQGINLQNCVRLFRYSYWLLHNFSVTFDYQKLTDTFYDEGHCGRSILNNENPSHVFFARCLGNLRANSRQSVKSSYPKNYFKESILAQKRSRFFSASKVLKTFHALVAPYFNTVDAADADSQ